MLELALISPNVLSYNEAWVYCLTLDYNGHKDWRMPTFNEWGSRNELLGWYEPELRWGDYIHMVASQKMPVIPVRDI